jgi:uncharacterized membrane protein YbhN (UPF0104 family)
LTLAKLLTTFRSRRLRRILNVGFVVAAIAVTVVTGQHFVRSGMPFANADIGLLTAAAVSFFAAYAFKAYGWRRLFAKHERPTAHALAAAGGAAAITGIALPGRFDDVVRIAVIRRFRVRRGRAGFGALCLSLVVVGLIDSAAITPLASIAAGLFDGSTGLRVGLVLVASAGIAAALVILVLPRLARTKLVRFRLVRWLKVHSACPREATKAWVLVSASWSLRALALYLLLGALGVGLSFELALLFLCATAASTALPIAPAGAATQAGAGAAILILAGVHSSHAIAFAVSAQTLVILAGAAVVLVSTGWEFLQRPRRPRAALV